MGGSKFRRQFFVMAMVAGTACVSPVAHADEGLRSRREVVSHLRQIIANARKSRASSLTEKTRPTPAMPRSHAPLLRRLAAASPFLSDQQLERTDIAASAGDPRLTTYRYDGRRYLRVRRNDASIAWFEETSLERKLFRPTAPERVPAAVLLMADSSTSR